MDKQEYREIIDGIRQGYARGDYERVIMFAREISPRKIRENRVLEMISDAYEAVGKPGLARQTLEVAYERMQNGKQIAYRLAEQSIRLNDIDGAVRYYEDFCRVASNDNRKYILKYEIATAGGLTIYDRIKILEEYNQKEVDEEALYEMARLYHEAGMGDQCAATVDELTLWFADGDYVKKALELKFAHTPLSPKQQAMYEDMMSEFMNEEEYSIQEPVQAPPVEDAFDNEAEEFANRYLNGTLQNTKSIDTDAINAALEEAEREKNASTKKLSLNETTAFTTMTANMANEAEASKAYAVPEPEPEPEKTPLERMIEEPKPVTPEVGGYYTRKPAEISDSSLNLNIDMEDDYNVEGQISIDQLFQTYANNIENNEANKETVKQVEAERLRQIREAVESSIVATPLMDIDDEPEEPKAPEEPEALEELSVFEEIKVVEEAKKPKEIKVVEEAKKPEEIKESEEPKVQAGYIPKTAEEKIPGDLTIEAMLAAMGESVEDEVLTAEVKSGVPVDDKTTETVTEPDKKSMAAPMTKAEPAPVVTPKEEKKTELLFDVEPPKEEFVPTNRIEDNPSIESELDDIMAELPIVDLPKEEGKPVVKPEMVAEPEPVKKDTAELELAMDDIMAEIPMDDFKTEKQSEEVEGLDDLGDFFAGAFAVEAVAETVETVEEKAEEKVIEKKAPVAEAVVETIEETATENKKPDAEPTSVEDSFSIESELDDIMAELPLMEMPEEEKKSAVEPEPVLVPEKIEEPIPVVEPKSADIPEAVVESEPAIESKPVTESEQVAEPEPVSEPKLMVVPESEPEDAADLELAMDDIMSELPLDDFKTEDKAEDKSKVETEDKSEEIEGLADLGDFFAGTFAAEAVTEAVVTAEEKTEEDKESVAEATVKTVEETVAEKKEPAAEPAPVIIDDKTETEKKPKVKKIIKIGDEPGTESIVRTDITSKPEPEIDLDLGLDSIMAEFPIEDIQPVSAPPKYTITDEIREDMAEFLLVDGMEEMIEEAIASIVYTKKNGNISGGNLIVTGDAKSGKTFLAITVVKAVTQEIGEGNGRVAKVQSTSINGKNIDKIFQKVEGNDIIIENVGDLDEDTLLGILTAMENGTAKNMVVFEGNVLAIETMINNHPEIERLFRNRIDIKELNISQWADVACDYANSRGFDINDMALLALHAKIDEVNMPTKRFGYEDAISIVDRAIANAEKRTKGKRLSSSRKGSGRCELVESDFDR